MVASATTSQNEEKPYPPKWAFHFENILQRKNCWVRCLTITLLKSMQVFINILQANQKVSSLGFRV
jgi:phage terminase large subunit-like protein